MSINVLQVTGFVLAGYSVMSNDCLQTLGAYFSSNKERTPKYIQAIFVCSVLSMTCCTASSSFTSPRSASFR